MSSGANAKRGDIVRNLTTGRIGQVVNYTNSGRILVKLPVTGGVEPWERWNCSVELEFVSGPDDPTRYAGSETTCHCGAAMNGSDHCPDCGCEQYESGCNNFHRTITN